MERFIIKKDLSFLNIDDNIKKKNIKKYIQYKSFFCEKYKIYSSQIFSFFHIISFLHIIKSNRNVSAVQVR